MSQENWQRITLRLPPDCTEFVAVQAQRSASSQNSEIIKSIRFRMEAQKAERPDASTSSRS